MGKIRIGAVFAAIALAVPLVVTTNAWAAESDDQTSVSAEDREMALVNGWYKFADTLGDRGSEGLLYHELAEDRSTMTIYWAGDVPPELSQFADSSGGTYVVTEVPRSLDDYETLTLAVRKAWDPSWGEFQGLSLPTDPSSVEVSIIAAVASSRATTARALASDDAIAAVEREFGVKLDSIVEREWEEWGWRQNDDRPWTTGAAIDGSGDEPYCTLGPGIIRSNGAKAALTAGHCLPKASGTYYNNGYVVGNTVFNSSYHDYRVISPTTSGKLYIGAFNNTSPSTRNIDYVAPPGLGDLVCQSGANTGEHCSLEIVSASTDAYGWPIWRADTTVLDIAGGWGDSGAAVYNRGSTSATMRGLVIGGIGGDLCYAGMAYHMGGFCGNAIQFIGITRILDTHDATIDFD